MSLRHPVPEATRHAVDVDAPQLTRVLERAAGATGAPFLHKVARVLPQDHARLPYFLARFQLDLFAPELFARHGIDYPVHIRNSVAKRQAEFIAGRLCAQSILAAYGQANHPVAIGSHREPLWPPGFIGSITHNGQYAAAVACPRRQLLGVGIDIETVIQHDARQAMMALVVSARETALLRALEGELDFDCLLTLVFSAKESFFKAAFAQVQAYFDFDALELTGLDPEQRLIHFRCTGALAESLPAGHPCQAHFDFLDHGSVFTVVVLRHEASEAAPAAISNEAQRAPSFDQDPK